MTVKKIGDKITVNTIYQIIDHQKPVADIYIVPGGGGVVIGDTVDGGLLFTPDMVDQLIDILNRHYRGKTDENKRNY